MKRRAAELGLLLGSLFAALLAVELGLRLFTRYPLDDAKTQQPDPVLRWRMRPELAGIDDRGFRNAAALASAEVVAIGDSHTYGFNASPEDSWPAQLERLTGRTVYNLGVGGYGLLEYWYLLDEALALQPREILVGVYVVNDLADVCARLLDVPYWRPWLHARGIDGDRCGSAAPHEARRHERDIWERLGLATAVGSLWGVATADQRMRFDIWRGAVEKAFVVDVPGTRTVMYHRWLRGKRESTDPARPQVAVALEVARRFLAEGRERSTARGSGFGVLLIPSKEVVYARYLAEIGYPRPEVYDADVHGEELGTAALVRVLDELGIPWIDARPGLERALVEVGDLYPLHRDDHPFAPGYRAYAEAARELLGRMKPAVTARQALAAGSDPLATLGRSATRTPPLVAVPLLTR